MICDVEKTLELSGNRILTLFFASFSLLQEQIFHQQDQMKELKDRNMHVQATNQQVTQPYTRGYHKQSSHFCI